MSIRARQLGNKTIEQDAAEMRVINAYTTTPSSVTDHGGLTGLLDDDHTQYMHITAARNVSAVHTYNPAAPGPAFILGANAQDQLIPGLNADLLDGVELVAIQAEIDADIAAHAGTNTHAQIDAHLANTANPHSTTLQLAYDEDDTLVGDPIIVGGLEIIGTLLISNGSADISGSVSDTAGAGLLDFTSYGDNTYWTARLSATSDLADWHLDRYYSSSWQSALRIQRSTGDLYGYGNIFAATELYEGGVSLFEKVRSRGMNLVTNGSGLMGDLTNFSTFESFNTTYLVSGGGSFYEDTYNTLRLSDEFIPVDVNLRYHLTGYVRNLSGTAGRFYAGVSCYDIDKKKIEPWQVFYTSGTETTLAAPLNPGDTTITLTDSTNWISNQADGSHFHSIAFYGYTNGKGYTYPDYTYTRLDLETSNGRGLYAWNNGAINYTTHVITLSPTRYPTGWDGAAYASGTAVSNAKSAGSYNNCAVGYKLAPNDWQSFADVQADSNYGYMDGLMSGGTPSDTKFRHGTAYVKLLFLLNYAVVGSDTLLNNLWFGEVADLPGTLTVSTVNNDINAGHTHAITTSSDPGPAASILSTDSNGYLQLKRLGLGVSPDDSLHISGGNALIENNFFYGAKDTGGTRRNIFGISSSNNVILGVGGFKHLIGGYESTGNLKALTLHGNVSSAELMLRRIDNTPTTDDVVGEVFFGWGNTSASVINYASIRGVSTDVTLGAEQGGLAFLTANVGGDGLAERIRITSAGNVGVNTSAPAYTLDVNGTLNAGATTLLGTTVTGSLDVIGADFTVGSNVFFVDISQLNAGINCAPDAQFALDVNGPIRGSVLVGNIARQIDDALMVCQFDGRFPYETDYTGDLLGHMGQVGTPTGGVIFRPGKFDKAVQIGDAEDNLISNPSFEVDTSGWSVLYSATVAQSTTDAWIGTGSGLITFTTTSSSGVLISHTTSAGGSYAAQVRMKNNSGGTGSTTVALLLRISYTDASLDDVYAYCTALTDEWQTVRAIGAADVAKTVSSVQVMIRDFSTTAYSILADGVQLTNTEYHVPYLDGSLGDGHSWAGTAHASSSSRTHGYVTYDMPSGVNVNSGTLMFWSYVTGHTSTASQKFIVSSDIPGSDYLFVSQYQDDGMLRVRAGATAFNSVSPHAPIGQWNLIAMTWEAGTTKLYINGVLNSSLASVFTAPPTKLYLGNDTASSTAVGAFIDNLAITSSALDADTIRAIYESNAPVFATTSNHSFRTASGAAAAWADSEGLWAREADGTAGLAFSAVDSKSWGGQTLDAGDVLIGSGTAVIKWDKSAAAMIVGNPSAEYIYTTGAAISFYNAGSLMGQLNGSTWTLGNTTTEHVEITASAFKIKEGALTHAVLTSGVLTLGQGSDEYIEVEAGNGVIMVSDARTVFMVDNSGGVWAGDQTGEHVAISGGIQIKDGSVVLGDWQTDGDIFIGSNVSAAGTTYFSIFATAQTYNTESMAAGDMLIGDNTASKANIFWDKSAGRLNFRGGKTTAAYIDTNGSITAGAGNITLDANGFTSSVGSAWTPGGTREISFKSSSTLVSGLNVYATIGGGGSVGTKLYIMDYSTAVAESASIELLDSGSWSGIEYNAAEHWFNTGPLVIDEHVTVKPQASNPGSPLGNIHMYQKGEKIVFQFDNALGTNRRYLYVDIGAGTTTWTNTTTAP